MLLQLLPFGLSPSSTQQEVHTQATGSSNEISLEPYPNVVQPDLESLELDPILVQSSDPTIQDDLVPPPRKSSGRAGSFLAKCLKPFKRVPKERIRPTYRYLPIVSGIVIPFSILLSIPSLTEPWYIRTDGHVIVEIRPNPSLLNVAVITSMICAVLASTCLVIRFAERGVKPMTQWCIVFLTIHDAISIATVTIFGVVHRFDDGFTYGQAFWMTVCATAASTITNITLIIDYLFTSDFAKRGSGLTHKQRSLAIITIILLFYIAIGSLIQTFLLGLSFLDALYFSVVSIETVGFGDIPPRDTGSRIFTIFYVTGGILNLALAVALAREVLIEGIVISLKNRVRAIQKLGRDRRIRARWHDAIKWRLQAKGVRLNVEDSDGSFSDNRLQIPFHKALWSHFKTLFGVNQNTNRRHLRRGQLNLEGLTMAQLEAAALEAGAPLSDLLPPHMVPNHDGGTNNPDTPSGLEWPFSGSGSLTPPLTHVRVGRMINLLGSFAIAMVHGSRARTAISGDTNAEDGNGEANFGVLPFSRTYTVDDATLTSVIEAEEKYAFYVRLFAALALFFFFWMAGAAIFSKTEGWAFGNAVYFCFISFSTVGYGDFAPVTAAGRSIFVVWALLGVGTMTILIAIVSEAYSARYKQIIHAEVMQTVTAQHEESRMPRAHFSSEVQSISVVRAFPLSDDPSSPSGNSKKHLHIHPLTSESTRKATPALSEKSPPFPAQIGKHASTLRHLLMHAKRRHSRHGEQSRVVERVVEGDSEEMKELGTILDSMESTILEMIEVIEGVDTRS